MTKEERKKVVEILKIAKAEIEWEYPMDYQIALDKAIGALEKEPISETDIILTREEYGELVSSEYDNGYAKGYEEALEQEPCEDCITEDREGGHWVEDIINGKALISCSECLHIVSNYEGCFHYCPYCGKELKGVVKNDM